MQVRAVSVICNVDVVTPDVEILAVKWLADVTDKLVGEVSVSLTQDLLFGLSGSHG